MWLPWLVKIVLCVIAIYFARNFPVRSVLYHTLNEQVRLFIATEGRS